MSKAPKNIEKIILGVALLAAGGLIALGWAKRSAVEEDFTRVGVVGSGGDPSVRGAERIPGTINSRTSNRQIAAATVPAAGVDDGQRPVDLFIGVPLFSQRKNANEPVDLVISPDVHAEIPNLWWLKNNVSPVFADSPQRDHDGDGFSNLEEFRAKTDPANKEEYPEPVTKLAYVKDESIPWLMEFGFEAGEGNWLPKIQNLADGTKNKVAFDKALNAGDLFFAEEPFKGRFKMLRIEERRQRNERLNIDETLKFGIYEDQKENKKGEVYEVPSRMPAATKPQWTRYDRSAVLELRALGKEGKEFKVEERTRFSLPSGGKEKKYLLKRVTPEEIEVEWEADGETQSLVITKG